MNPKLSTSPIARTANLVGQTKKDNSKRLAKITQSYIKEFREDPLLLEVPLLLPFTLFLETGGLVDHRHLMLLLDLYLSSL